MTDPDIKDTIMAAEIAAAAIDTVRDKVWSLVQKDPFYGLMVMQALRSCGREFFRASIAVEAGLSGLQEVSVIERSGVA